MVVVIIARIRPDFDSEKELKIKDSDYESIK
jgi:hypothetical protein